MNRNRHLRCRTRRFVSLGHTLQHRSASNRHHRHCSYTGSYKHRYHLHSRRHTVHRHPHDRRRRTRSVGKQSKRSTYTEKPSPVPDTSGRAASHRRHRYFVDSTQNSLHPSYIRPHCHGYIASPEHRHKIVPQQNQCHTIHLDNLRLCHKAVGYLIHQRTAPYPYVPYSHHSVLVSGRACHRSMAPARGNQGYMNLRWSIRLRSMRRLKRRYHTSHQNSAHRHRRRRHTRNRCDYSGHTCHLRRPHHTVPLHQPERSDIGAAHTTDFPGLDHANRNNPHQRNRLNRI